MIFQAAVESLQQNRKTDFDEILFMITHPKKSSSKIVDQLKALQESLFDPSKRKSAKVSLENLAQTHTREYLLSEIRSICEILSQSLSFPHFLLKLTSTHDSTDPEAGTKDVSDLEKSILGKGEEKQALEPRHETSRPMQALKSPRKSPVHSRSTSSNQAVSEEESTENQDFAYQPGLEQEDNEVTEEEDTDPVAPRRKTRHSPVAAASDAPSATRALRSRLKALSAVVKDPYESTYRKYMQTEKSADKSDEEKKVLEEFDHISTEQDRSEENLPRKRTRSASFYSKLKADAGSLPDKLDHKITAAYTTKRRRWTKEEEQNLIEGVQAHGLGNWKEILYHYDFQNRTCTDLKDKWRNLVKYGHIASS